MKGGPKQAPTEASNSEPKPEASQETLVVIPTVTPQ